MEIRRMDLPISVATSVSLGDMSHINTSVARTSQHISGATSPGEGDDKVWFELDHSLVADRSRLSPDRLIRSSAA